MSEAEGESINARMARINHLILGQPEATSKVSRAVGEALSREGLLDAVCLLFDECNKDFLKKKDRNIFDFVNKCEYDVCVCFSRQNVIYVCGI